MPPNSNIGDALPEVRTYGASYDESATEGAQLADARAALAKAALAVALLCSEIEASGRPVPYDALFEVLQ